MLAKETQELKKYAVIQCPHCGYIQGRTVVGSVFKYKGPFKSVNCYRCGKRVVLSEVTILFSGESPELISGWIRGYKTSLASNRR